MKKRKKKKYKNIISQKLKNTTKIYLLELFETYDKDREALFEIISGINIEPKIQTNALEVWLIILMRLICSLLMMINFLVRR